MSRPAPGMIVRISDECCWPERRGLHAVVTDTQGVRCYPVAGLGRDETIVRVKFDPLVTGEYSRLPNGSLWSCVMKTSWLIAEDRGAGAGSPRGSSPDYGEAARQTGVCRGPGPTAEPQEGT